MHDYREVRNILKNYLTLKAEIKNIELDINDLDKPFGIGLPSIPTSEKTSKTYKYTDAVGNEAVDIAEQKRKLEEAKAIKQGVIDRIDNAMTLLTTEEKVVITMRYFKRCAWKTVCLSLHLGYPTLKDRDHAILKRIEPFVLK